MNVDKKGCWLKGASITALLLFLQTFLTALVYGSYNIVTDHSIKNYNILKKFPIYSITECVMKCDAEPECNTQGFEMGGGSKTCLLLKMKEQRTQGTFTNTTGDNGNNTVTILQEIGTDILFEKQVMTLPKPVHGNWGSWSTYGRCSKSCGQGVAIRTRCCSHPSAAYGGNECEGNSTESKTCEVAPCPIDGIWGAWAVWTSCSKTCGTGMQSRTRYCDNPSAKHGGLQCHTANGNRSDTELKHQSCNPQICPVPPCPPEKDVDYEGGDIVGVGFPNTLNWQQCAKHCRANNACKYWVWLDTRFKTNPNLFNYCGLKHILSVNERKVRAGVWVGDRDCA